MMSGTGSRSASTSSVSSISLLEIKAETSLVLKAFLRQSLALHPGERPGRVGGAYKDHSKYSVQLRPKAKNGLPSQDQEDVSSGDEKKKSLRERFMRTIRRPAKDPGPEPKDPPGSPEKDTRPKGAIGPPVAHLRDHLLPEDDAFSPSSTSDEDNSKQRQRKKQQKKRSKLKKQLSGLLHRKVAKNPPEKPEPQLPRPSKLPVGGPSDTLHPDDPRPQLSPNHPPEFYEEVAGRLEQIAQRSQSIKTIQSGSQLKPLPPTLPVAVRPTEPDVNKEEVVRQLIQVLSMEADAITTKIQSDPFLRSKLTRLSYPSFAKLLDAFSNSEVEQPPVPLPATPLTASPTLRRVAVTMEVSRRVVTATGTQRMQGYAERYMETFTPWVKSHGGWENIVHLEEFD